MSVRKLSLAFSGLFVFAFGAFAQQPSCFVGATPYVVATEGLSELIAPLTFSCSGGTAGSVVSSDIFITLNTNVTNRVAATGQPANLAVTVDTGSGSSPVSATPQFSGSSTIIINQVQYTVPTPNSTAVTVQITGIRAAVANITNGTASGQVTAQILNTGFFITNPTNTVIVASTLGPSMLATVQNTGFPCSGSALPAGSVGFSGLIAAGTAFSTVRVTENATTAFSPRSAGADTGNRVLVNLSGYPSGVSVYVPTTVVGNYGTTPTSGGTLEGTASGGVYTPNSNQLLLTLVTGADSHGAGGSVAAAPGSIQTLDGMTQLTLNNGSAYAVYEVVDGNPNKADSAQIPIYVGSPASVCTSSGSAQISVVYAPTSTVSTATPTDPIPRYLQEIPGPDCTIFNDCNSLSAPRLAVDQTTLSLNGNSQGNPQVTTLNISNAGQGQFSFNVAVTYQTGSGWLTVSPSSGVNTAAVTIAGDPTLLAPGIYTATVIVSAGTAGSVSIPLTFTVGQVGVTIKGIVSAASFVPGGSITPNSYAAIFGVNLSGQNVSVTIGSTTCTTCISYAGPTQINFLVPQQVASSLFAGYVKVTVTVNGLTSNTFSVPLATNAPGIFNPGIINQDNSVNLAGQPTTQNQYVSIYMTGLGLPLSGTITVNMGSQAATQGLAVIYAGQAPTLPGLEQVIVTIPSGLTPVNGSVPLAVCVSQTAPQAPLCSPAVNLYVH